MRRQHLRCSGRGAQGLPDLDGVMVGRHEQLPRGSDHLRRRTHSQTFQAPACCAHSSPEGVAQHPLCGSWPCAAPALSAAGAGGQSMLWVERAHAGCPLHSLRRLRWRACCRVHPRAARPRGVYGASGCRARQQAACMPARCRVWGSHTEAVEAGRCKPRGGRRPRSSSLKDARARRRPHTYPLWVYFTLTQPPSDGPSNAG